MAAPNIELFALPDELSASALWDRYEYYANLPGSDPVGGRRINILAGSLIELGSLPSVANSEARSYFTWAKDLLEESMRTTQRQTHLVAATLMRTFIDAYSGYAHGLPSDANQRSVQQMRVSRLMATVRQAPVHPIQSYNKTHSHKSGVLPCHTRAEDRKATSTKLAFLQLCLGNFSIRPSTPRTRDIYDALLWQGTRFVPVSAASSYQMNYDPSTSKVLKFDFRELVRQANIPSPNEELISKPTSELVEDVALLLEQETAPDKPDFSPEEGLLLVRMRGLLTESIAAGHGVYKRKKTSGSGTKAPPENIEDI